MLSNNEKDSKRVIREKASYRLAMNIRLIAVSFIVFIFILTTRPEILTEKLIFSFQLILAIPFILMSCMSLSKMGYSKRSDKWKGFSWFNFVIGYAFLLNAIGILIAIYVNLLLAVLFFSAIWILQIAYSILEVSYDKFAKWESVLKDGFFILLQIILGLLPALGVF
ncbi:MAG: hypothetical protein KKH88_04040 [Nanoarchaeota archaeon]|nr:hypothetical protein [Nanoarchaeota archaeon]